MGKFIISTKANGQYQFRLAATTGEIILTSGSYSSKSGALNGISAVRSNSFRDDRYDKKVAASGKYYFNLKGANGEVIGTSEMYETETGMKAGIKSVATNTIDSVIDEGDSEASVETPHVTISEFVKNRRKQSNLSQEELSLKAGVGVRFVRELEAGDKQTLRIDKVNQVLQLFGFRLGPVPGTKK
ncbi:DUF1508 domain-containing protein [Paraflavitalea pollutisoli]|uniref:DUF1508 domain-containing protein n=1 Tax=Paraflavitalea pollutisoli TaxID=3034143 RepID=UPI0023ECB6CA|nr:DUF1508 domain-containing protein [Paraflavitalea sp. H1-2-19X]